MHWYSRYVAQFSNGAVIEKDSIREYELLAKHGDDNPGFISWFKRTVITINIRSHLLVLFPTNTSNWDKSLMVLTLRFAHLRNTTSMGIAFVPLAKSNLCPIENLQILVSLLSTKEVPSIMEELKQYTKFYSMVKILRTSLSSNVIGFFRKRLDRLMNM